MRKDLKIGLAIGGVLLAVLVVYLVVPKDQPGQGQDDQVALEDQQAGEDGALDDGALDEGEAPLEEPAEDFAEDEAPVTPDAPEGVAADPTPPAAAGETPVAGAAGAADGGEATTAGGADGGQWGDLLNGNNVLTPPLRTSTPQPEAGGDDAASPFGGDEAGTAGATVESERTEFAAGTEAPGIEDPFSPSPRSAARGSRAAVSDAAARSGGGGSTHVVQEGDTLSDIAARVYGSAKYWKAIEKANPAINPNRLRPNTVLNLPNKAEVVGGGRGAARNGGGAGDRTRQIDPAREYRVQPGDSLGRIAKNKLGREDRWKELYDLNRAAIGPDPAKLKLDMVLKLPAESAGSGSR